MNIEKYISSNFRRILSENLEEKTESLMNKLNYDKTLKLNKDREFDYVQEGKQTCNECGSNKMYEGECKECGWKGNVEVMERKGKSKVSAKDIEDLLGDIKHDMGKDKEEDEFEFELELDESMYSYDEYERMRDFGTEDELQAFQDQLVSGNYRNEMKEKLHGKQHKIDKNKNGRIDAEDFKMLRKQQDEEQLYEVEFEKSEFNEGSKPDFLDLDDDGDKKESMKSAAKDAKKKDVNEKWEGDVDVKQTGEYSDMSIEELNAAIKKQKAKNDKVKESGKKVSHADRTKMSQLYFAKRAKQGWKGKGKAKVKESILYTESDLIDLIEGIVNEEKKKFSVKEPKGYKEYERAHKADKKENDDYLKSVAKKMSDYLKSASDSGSKYEMKKTEKFPTENGGMKKGIRKKYTPSDAVDDYQDAFSYPGMTNLVFDEIKPTEKNIEKYLKGHRTTGNAQVDEDGNALGNVVPSEVGDKFFQNFKDNLYGQEQMDASYKRQPQPVDQAGEETERGSLKSKRGKKTSQSVLNKVDEGVNEKEVKKLNEEFERIQNLMGYSRKTQ